MTHPWLARVRGTYRRHWTEGQRRLAEYDAAASVLTDAGVEFLRPADQQVGGFLHDPTVQQLGRPRVAVDWWTAPNALDALADAGWRVDDEASRARSLRARLTRTDWPISTEGGMSAELVNFFDPWIVDERRDADVWERARAAPGAGPPNASASDVAVAALTDQLDLAGAVRWALGAAAVLDAVGENVSLQPGSRPTGGTVGAPDRCLPPPVTGERGAESKRGTSSAAGPGAGRSASPADDDASTGVGLGPAASAGSGASTDCGSPDPRTPWGARRRPLVSGAALTTAQSDLGFCGLSWFSPRPPRIRKADHRPRPLSPALWR